MLKSLLFLSIILFADCADNLSNETSSSTPSNTQQLVCVYPSMSWRHPYWTLNGKSTVVAVSTRYNKYNFKRILDDCTIYEGQSYPLHIIEACIADNIEKTFRIACRHVMDEDSDNLYQYLSEIQLCYDRESKSLEDCDDTGKITCDKDELIHIPKQGQPFSPAAH